MKYVPKQRQIKIKLTDNYLQKCCKNVISMDLYLIDKDEVYLAMCPTCHKLFWAGATYHDYSRDKAQEFEIYNCLSKRYKKILKKPIKAKKCQ